MDHLWNHNIGFNVHKLECSKTKNSLNKGFHLYNSIIHHKIIKSKYYYFLCYTNFFNSQMENPKMDKNKCPISQNDLKNMVKKT